MSRDRSVLLEVFDGKKYIGMYQLKNWHYTPYVMVPVFTHTKKGVVIKSLKFNAQLVSDSDLNNVRFALFLDKPTKRKRELLKMLFTNKA